MEEDERLDFDHSIYAVMATLLYLHYGKTHKMMNHCLNDGEDPNVFLNYLTEDFKRSEGIAENILQRVRELDNRMVLNYFKQKKLRYHSPHR